MSSGVVGVDVMQLSTPSESTFIPSLPHLVLCFLSPFLLSFPLSLSLS
jgi:hypothetical protein